MRLNKKYKAASFARRATSGLLALALASMTWNATMIGAAFADDDLKVAPIEAEQSEPEQEAPSVSSSESDETPAVEVPAPEHEIASAPLTEEPGAESGLVPIDVSEGLHVFTADASGISVKVVASATALPADATLEAELDSSPGIEAALENSVASQGRDLVDYRAVDITIRDAIGSVIEPAEPVLVSLNNVGLEASESISVYHVPASCSGAEGVPAITATADLQTFSAAHFSTYAVVSTMNGHTVAAQTTSNPSADGAVEIIGSVIPFTSQSSSNGKTNFVAEYMDAEGYVWLVFGVSQHEWSKDYTESITINGKDYGTYASGSWGAYSAWQGVGENSWSAPSALKDKEAKYLAIRVDPGDVSLGESVSIVVDSSSGNGHDLQATFTADLSSVYHMLQVYHHYGDTVAFDAAQSGEKSSANLAASTEFAPAGVDWRYTRVTVDGTDQHDGDGSIAVAVPDNSVVRVDYYYAEPTFTVTWADEDGSILETDADVPYGSTPSYDGATPEKPATPQYSYTFTGWDHPVEPVISDVTYKAVYEQTLRSYPVTFDMQGHGEQVPAQDVDYGSTATRPADPSEEGYTFGGWFTDEDATDEYDFASPVEGERVLYAKWTINTYTVSFEENGGTEVADQTVAHGSTATKPDDPTREDYLFEGWFADEELTKPFDFDAPVKSDTTVYARWSFVPDPQLTVSKSSNVAEGEAVYSGDTITYTISVANSGNVDMHDVELVDPLTGDLWTVGTLAVGEEKSYTTRPYTVTDADAEAGQVENTATARGTAPDEDEPREYTGTSTVPVDIPATREPHITKAVTKIEGPYTGTHTGSDIEGYEAKAGDTVTYEIRVWNTGNQSIAGLSVSDKLPYGSDVVIDTVTLPAAGEEQGGSEENPLVFTYTYTLTNTDIFKSTNLDENAFTNTATAAADGVDPVSASATLQTGQAPSDPHTPGSPGMNGRSLKVQKYIVMPDGSLKNQDYSAPFVRRVGHDVDFVVTVANQGNVILTNIALTDPNLGIGTNRVTGTESPEAGTAIFAGSLMPGESLRLDTREGDPACFTTLHSSEDDLAARQPNKMYYEADNYIYSYAEADAPGWGLHTELQYAASWVGYSFERPTAVRYAYGGTVPPQYADAGTWLDETEGVPTEYFIGDQVTLPAPDPVEGYTFEGWAKGAAGSSFTMTRNLATTRELVSGETDRYGFDLFALPTIVGTWKADFSKLEAEDVEGFYTGKPYTIEVEGLAEGDEVTYLVDGEEVENSFVDVQDTDVTVNVKRGDETKTVTVNVSVKPRTVTVTSATPEPKAYDGSPLTSDDYSVSEFDAETGAGFVEGEGFDDGALRALITGAQTLVGSSPNTFGFNPDAAQGVLNASTQASNYRFVKDEGTLVVTPPPNNVYDDDPEGDDPGKVVSKDADDAEYALGDKITFSITVKNIFDAGMTVTVTDENAYFGDDESAHSTTLELAAGVTGTVTATHVVTEADIIAGTVANTAAATFPNPDDPDKPISYEDEAEADPADPAPALVVTKEADVNLAEKAGDVITYTVTVTNTGNLTMSNVSVVDELAGLTGGRALDAGTLAPGESKTFDGVAYTVTDADMAAGKVHNVATAMGDVPEGVDEEPEVTPGEVDTPTAKPDPHLTVSKQVTNTPASGTGFALGEEVAYRIVATNDGNVTLSDVVVTDPLTGDTFEVGTLAVGASSEKFEASYRVTEADIRAGSVRNVATAEADVPDDVDDPTIEPGEVEVPTDKPSSGLEVAKSSDMDGETLLALGDVVTYTVTVKNTGNQTVRDIAIDDTLASASTVTAGSWDVEKLAPGETAAVAYTYEVTQADLDAGVLVNVATVTGTSDDPDADPIEESDETSSQTDSMPALKVTKTITSTPSSRSGYAAGETIVYVVGVENTGTVTLTGVSVKDPFTGDSWNIETLAVGARRSFTARHTVTKAEQGTTVVNTATASGTGATPGGEPGQADGNASVEAECAKPADPTPAGPGVAPSAPVTPPASSASGASASVAAGAPAASTVIADDATPLAQGVGQGGSWSLFDLLCTILTALLCLIMLIGAIGRSREDDDEAETKAEEDEQQKDVKRRRALRIGSLIPAIFAILLFIFTQDLTQPMTFFDIWSLLFAIVAIVNIVLTVLSRKKKEDDDEDGDLAEAAA